MSKTKRGPVVVTHGGAGAPREFTDGAQAGADAGAKVFASGGAALDAVIAASKVLEDDPRFNAGTGSNLRMDGVTIEMDASVMTSDGRSGAVAALQRVQHPILVAAAVREKTPHLLLAGEGALRFARRIGLPDYDPTTERAREKWQRRFAELKKAAGGDDENAMWNAHNLRGVWNFERDLDECLGDTVGAVARDAAGNFAVGLSTGGTALMLLGRVGDTPIIGAGFFAGPAGAAAATGTGEEIIRQMLARRVYDFLVEGLDATAACERALAACPPDVGLGVIAVGRDSHGSATNRTMPVGVK